MKRQQASVSTRVYAYGCLMPFAGWDRAQVESRRQHAFWDTLVQIDHAHQRTLTERAMADVPESRLLHEQITTHNQHITALISERRACRHAARRRIATPELDIAIDTAIAARRAVQALFWTQVKTWRREHPDTVKAIELQRRQEMTKARQQSGCYWGNYNRVVDDFDRARKRVRKIGRQVKAHDPRREDGCLTVQVQRTRSGLGAAPFEILSGQCAAIAITMDPTDSRQRHATLKIRIDEDETMLLAPVLMHRPLPPEGRIKRVQFTWRRDGAQRRFQVAFTITTPIALPTTHPQPSAIGIDLGFRKEEDGSLLIATSVDSSGQTQQVVLDAHFMSQMDYADALMSDVAQLHAAGEDRRADRRETEARNLKAKLIRHRRERYRLQAQTWCQAYAIVGIEEWDLSTVAKIKPHETAQPTLHATARSQRNRAALADLRTALEQQAAKSGTTIIRITGKTTQHCGECHTITQAPKDRSERIWTCSGCGAIWDQDENAASNLLKLATGEIVNEPSMRAVVC